MVTLDGLPIQVKKGLQAFLLLMLIAFIMIAFAFIKVSGETDGVCKCGYKGPHGNQSVQGEVEF